LTVRRIAFAVATALLALPATLAHADAPQEPTGGGYYLRDYQELTQSAPQQPWWGMTFDLAVKLGVVIGLIYLTMWALRRFMLGSQAGARVARLPGRLEVLDTTHLAPNRTVYLVEVADRVLVLGATQTTLSTLAEIKEPGAIDLLKARPLDEPAAPPAFAEQFQKLTAALGARTAAGGRAVESAGGAPVEAVGATTFLHDKIGELRSLTARRRHTSEEITTP
jgi:flagellar protein FliO/FliZ